MTIHRTTIDAEAMDVPMSDTASRELPQMARRLRHLAGKNPRKTRALVDALLHQIGVEERRDLANDARRAGL